MRLLVSAFRGPKHTIDQQDLFPLADDQFGLKNPSRRVILLWYYNSRLTNCYIKLLLVNLLMINYLSVGHEYQFAGDSYVASRFSSLMSRGWRLRQWLRKYSHQLPLSWVYAIPSSDSTGCYLLRVAKSIQWVLDLILILQSVQAYTPRAIFVAPQCNLTRSSSYLICVVARHLQG